VTSSTTGRRKASLGRIVDEVDPSVHRDARHHGLERAEAYFELLQDAVDTGHGGSAGEEELTARPTTDRARPAARSSGEHRPNRSFAAVRHVVRDTRLVNRLVGTVVHEGSSG